MSHPTSKPQSDPQNPSPLTFVLIPGAWHTPDSYLCLTTTLSSTFPNLAVHTIPLTTVAAPQASSSSLASDTASIRSFISNLLSTTPAPQIILGMHSYGGAAASSAISGLDVSSRRAAGLGGGVAALVYLSGFALLGGESCAAAVETFSGMDPYPIVTERLDDGSCILRAPEALVVAPGISPEDDVVTKALETLGPWNGDVIYQFVEEAGWMVQGLCVVYVLTSEDAFGPVSFQRWMIGRMREAGVDVSVVEVSTGHSAHLTATEKIVGVVEGIVNELFGKGQEQGV